ncbi:UvrD-helicase domain-containing protein [Ligilactobacillus equi]|uniref:DNA 3'-5' helicase n=1 Tax=Ligilactobacillus equi DPC 6820 TaxID=1392007 RepID=V7HWZ8_9LACO|nr:ATP-dependent helicase [Ligilactobacillus equi]ETA73738.1 UvrD/REP helicase [Ligilactobacillus equi DPC 6820]
MDQNEALKIIELIGKFKLSNEQKNILKEGIAHPTLVNACAGSGKTTIFMLTIIYNALIGNSRPHDVLGITFSKKAQLDMRERYNEYIKRVQILGINISDWGSPSFFTFHAFFYKLLRFYMPQYKTVSVLPSEYKHYITYFKLPNKSKELTNSESLKQIFEVKSQLVNRMLSSNGLDPNYNSTAIQDYLAMVEKKELSVEELISLVSDQYLNKGWVENYIYALKEYSSLKERNQQIDFEDMQKLLYVALNDERLQSKIKGAMMRRWNVIVIDEFQDINALQWALMNRIFSEKSFEQLMVIGDDDQSIYSFRGSSPDFIQKFSTFVNYSVTFNLSTNYRTGGNILDSVIPVITKNTLRLEKSLKAFNKGGKVYKIESKEGNHGDEFFEKMLKNLANSPNESSAILVRYNKDKPVIADVLAYKDVYLDVGSSSNILQNDKVYDVFMGLIKAFYYDDFILLANYANRIGFGKYAKKLKSVVRYRRINTITDYVNWVIGTNDDDVADDSDLEVIRCHRKFEKMKHKKEKDLSKYLREVDLITNLYFQCMTKIYHVYSSERVETIKNYLYKLTKKFSEFEELEESQDRNLRLLSAIVNNGNNLTDTKQPSIKLDTLHESKGLEWDNVYLYGLTDSDLTDDLMAISKAFPADTTFEEFYTLFNYSDLEDLMDYGSFDSMAYVLGALLGISPNACEMYFEDVYKLDDLQPSDRLKIIQSLSTEGMLSKMVEENTQLRTAMRMFYAEIMAHSKFVEDERRLLYVGMTRAKKKLYIDYYVGKASPLLDEIKYPNSFQN